MPTEPPPRDPLVEQLYQGRSQFLELVDALRPELHRYCARMTGSVFDGEDLVQDTLVRAYFELSTMRERPELRSWLFRIAHDRAVDFLRRYERSNTEPLETSREPAMDDDGPDDLLARQEALAFALRRFLTLPLAQRSAVILKDVLGHSLEEIASLLGASVPAVKSGLHRARATLRRSADEPLERSRPVSPELARYAELFNARDWNALRAMLSEGTRLELRTLATRTGQRQVGEYFTNYDRRGDWWFVAGWLEGQQVLGGLLAPDAPRPAFFVRLRFEGGKVVEIIDHRRSEYLGDDARFIPATLAPHE